MLIPPATAVSHFKERPTAKTLCGRRNSCPFYTGRYPCRAPVPAHSRKRRAQDGY